MANMDIENCLPFEESGGGSSTPPCFKKMAPSKTSTPLMKQVSWRNPARAAGRHILDEAEVLGSPSYPSPLDRIRSMRSRRHGGFSSPPPMNRSLPLQPISRPEARRSNLDRFKGDGLNTFSFSPSHSKGSFLPTNYCGSLDGSWAFYNYVGERRANNLMVQNPNKAVFTINARTSQILVANKMASFLLQVPASRLVGQRLCSYFTSKKEQVSLSETELESSGELVIVSGKVMELSTSEGLTISVSVWIRRLSGGSPDPCCLVVMEPVERTAATFDLDSRGCVARCDANMAMLHGFSSPEDLVGLHISQLIPALILPPNPQSACPEQTATGRMRDGTSFPLTVALKSADSVLHWEMWVFANISGLITMLPDGSIHSCNTNFSQMLFGFSQDELTGKPITTLIPSFYEDLDHLDTSSLTLDDDDDLIVSVGSDLESSEDSLLPPRPDNPMGRLHLDDTTDMLQSLNLAPDLNGNSSPAPIPEGGTASFGRHKDGSDLAVVYQVKRVELDHSCLYCLWLSRDGGLPQQTQDVSTQYNPQECDTGLYSAHYTTLKQIGKGAFGCVKMGYRNTDGLLVITKFICKSKVYEEAWTYDSANSQRVPMEVHLLTTLKHPNIVEVLDVFENEHFYQVVMGKHGTGMDLFEFIDRSPHIDEGLASYMFRQVVSALTYLHSLNILHRDIKDENIILDQVFHVKLIDFGSAAMMEPGRVFTTFCGTLVYCSPEVLRGQGYRGPELEMWALGVTLYTLVFGENPWQDVEETMAAVLPHPPPSPVSPDLWDLLNSLLHPDPARRCSLPRCAAHPWTNLPVRPGDYRLQDVISTGYDELFPPRYFHQLPAQR